MPFVDDLAAWITDTPTPYHAPEHAADLLSDAGFVRRDAAEPWSGPAQRWFVVDGGSLIAVAGAPDRPYRMIGAHTDSPNLRLKPRPATPRAGWAVCGVEVYGGPLLNSWLDRDLGLAGRLTVRAEDGWRSVLVADHHPLARIPQLAIHLDRDVNTSGLVLDRQKHLAPVWSPDPDGSGPIEHLARGAGIDPDDVLGWDLMFFDVQPAGRAGPGGELLVGGRLDNLVSTRCALASIIDTAPTEADTTAVIALFDHEEVGSVSATGAAGALLRSTLERGHDAEGGTSDGFARRLSTSSAVSVDMAHATHPNYAERHEPDHQIAINAGPVIKANASQRYASDAESTAPFVLACEQADVPLQHYVNRSDLPCGSTIGPVTAAGLGVPTVDVGVAQLAMHSARETAGAKDPAMLVRSLSAFLSPPKR